MPRAVITHLLSAFQPSLLAAINNTQAWHLLLQIPCYHIIDTSPPLPHLFYPSLPFIPHLFAGWHSIKNHSKYVKTLKLINDYGRLWGNEKYIDGVGVLKPI